MRVGARRRRSRFRLAGSVSIVGVMGMQEAVVWYILKEAQQVGDSFPLAVC
jgi:hypothetical protein